MIRIQELLVQSTQRASFFQTSLLWSGLVILILFFLFKDRAPHLVDPIKKMLLCYQVQTAALCGMAYFACETACTLYHKPLGFSQTWSLVWIGLSLFLVSAVFSVVLHVMNHWTIDSDSSQASHLPS